VKKNVNLRIIQTLLGHCNIASTEIYTHIEKEKIKEEAQKAFLSNI
jgi:site-specific recombinase XerD